MECTTSLARRTSSNSLSNMSLQPMPCQQPQGSKTCWHILGTERHVLQCCPLGKVTQVTSHIAYRVQLVECFLPLSGLHRAAAAHMLLDQGLFVTG